MFMRVDPKKNEDQSNRLWIRDEKDLNTLFNKYFAPLVYFAWNIINDQPIAEEIVSDAFIKIWERRENFNSENAIKSFLYLVVKNASINFLRLQKRSDQLEKELGYLNDNLESNKLTHIIQSEMYRQVLAAIETLPKTYRNIVSLFYLEEKSCSEISDQLNLSITNVRVQKMRGLRLLRKVISK